ncbi:Rhodanese-like protein [Viridothelium virens]|uniref:Rhodanese-like protein n=1 Tax=Viridothelium virens TaxID=1048519 RepID=A0A6A6GZ69_VIRVR|nr:Rhodanese-like protein [Viridothelium virens]
MTSRTSAQGLALLRSARFARCAASLALRSSAITTARRNNSSLNSPPRIASQCRRQTQVRWHSELSSGSKSKRLMVFLQIKSLSSSPSQDHILIDVREPSEYNAGFIPTAINIPVTSQPDALFLSPEDFEDRFGFEKPPPDKELVFYCKAGVRSSAAAQLAQQQGYDKVAEYRGSWLDWQKKGGGPQ